MLIASNRGLPWTEEDVTTLVGHFENLVSMRSICLLLGRTPCGILSKLESLNKVALIGGVYVRVPPAFCTVAEVDAMTKEYAQPNLPVKARVDNRVSSGRLPTHVQQAIKELNYTTALLKTAQNKPPKPKKLPAQKMPTLADM